MQILSGSKDCSIKIWDAKTYDLISILSNIYFLENYNYNIFLDYNSSILTATFSPGGKMIVSGSRDKTLQVWKGGKLQRLL